MNIFYFILCLIPSASHGMQPDTFHYQHIICYDHNNHAPIALNIPKMLYDICYHDSSILQMLDDFSGDLVLPNCSDHDITTLMRIIATGKRIYENSNQINHENKRHIAKAIAHILTENPPPLSQIITALIVTDYLHCKHLHQGLVKSCIKKLLTTKTLKNILKSDPILLSDIERIPFPLTNSIGIALINKFPDLKARLLSVTAPTPLRTLAHQRTMFSSQVNDLTFFNNDKKIITASSDCTAKIWNIKTGQCLITLQGHRARILKIALSPDEKHVLTCSQDSNAICWNTEHGNVCSKFTGHIYAVLAGAFSHDSKQIITGSLDKRAIIWDAMSATKYTELAHRNKVKGVYLFGDGIRACTTSENKIFMWNIQNQEKPHLIKTLRQDSSIQQILVNRKETKIASTARYGIITTFHIEKNKRRTMHTHMYCPNTFITAMHMSNNFKDLLIAYNNKQAFLHETTFLYDYGMLEYHCPITTAKLSTDQHYIAIGGQDGSATIFDLSMVNQCKKYINEEIDCKTALLLIAMKNHKALNTIIKSLPIECLTQTKGKKRTCIVS